LDLSLVPHFPNGSNKMALYSSSNTKPCHHQNLNLYLPTNNCKLFKKNSLLVDVCFWKCVLSEAFKKNYIVERIAKLVDVVELLLFLQLSCWNRYNNPQLQ
jgi:hypothetical protein